MKVSNFPFRLQAFIRSRVPRGRIWSWLLDVETS